MNPIADRIAQAIAEIHTATGEAPKVLRVNRHWRREFLREFEGEHFVYDPDYARRHPLRADESEFMGVRLRWDVEEGLGDILTPCEPPLKR